MSFALLLALALSTSPQNPAQAAPQVAPQVIGDRPAVPYSLPPVSGEARGVGVDPIVPHGTPAPVPFEASGPDDSVPLPVPAVRREGPEGDVEELPASGDPFFLGFVAGPHHPDPAERVDARLFDAALPSYDDGRPTAETYAFVMFSQRMTPERLARLEAAGARLLGFHPHYTQKVALPATAISRVAELPFVRWIGLAQPWQKVHPALTDRLGKTAAGELVDVWVDVFESDVGSSSVRRMLPGAVAIGPQGSSAAPPRAMQDVWESNGWQQAALEAAGLHVIDFNERIHAFHARLAPSLLDAVVALDFVQFVELDPEDVQDHDESIPMINADDTRNFHDGGTNQVAVVGMADSGMEFNHWDLSNHDFVGWDISGSASGTPYEDLSGHGTHVSGSFFGQGYVEPGHTGVAPGLGWGSTGRILIVRIFDTGAPQVVDDAAVISLLSAPVTFGSETTPRPHVHNHSWGIAGAPLAPWVGSEAEARLWDATVYSDAQLPIRTASNSGPGSSTIGLQGSAKNVLTVGNVSDFDDGSVQAGELWTSSGQGPTGDGRWKPNVVAAGHNVTSADAFNLTGYVPKSGTSMAAPQVAGVVASMIDKDAATFAYLPERISAQLMATARRKDDTSLSTPTNAHLDQFGAGRIDATRALWSGAGGTWTSWAFGLGNSANMADFTVPSGATRLVAVMHYVEPAASAGASAALIDDFDLWLDQPPLTASSNTGEWFAQQSLTDNTEIRVITNPIAGTWRWKVHPDSVSGFAYFGLTIYIETVDTSPAIAPTLTASKSYAQPLEPVRFTYDLGTSGATISGVHLTASTSTGASNKTATVLADGITTNLLNNPYGGWELMLGNVDPYLTRTAYWEPYWASNGLKTFTVTARSDNASNSGHVASATVMVDGVNPSSVPNLQSTTHTPGVSSCGSAVTMTWSPASDAHAGIQGYSYVWDHDPAGAAPTTVMTTGTSYTVGLPSSFFQPWYFHVRAIDWAGNDGPTTTSGPYLVDPYPVASYCTAKVNSQGCVPTMISSGLPSTSTTFTVGAVQMLNNKSGLLFWGTSPSATPFNGGVKCVANPVKRTPIQNSGGNPPPNDCSGTYSFDFTPAYMAAKGISAGDTIYTQHWTRDTGSSFNTGLSNGLKFVVCP